MQTRRDFLRVAACAGVMLTVAVPVLARQGAGHARSATAVTQVFGDGIRLIAVAIEYDVAVSQADLTPADFRIENRSVTSVFVSTSTDPADRAAQGSFVIVMLSPKDAAATLAVRAAPPNGMGQPPAAAGKPPKGAGKPPGGGGGPGKAGDVPVFDTSYRAASARVLAAPGLQAATSATSAPPAVPAKAGKAGKSAASARLVEGTPLPTNAVRNLIVDDFTQREFQDPQTGKLLRYNLFVPANYDASKSYPLVLFMHDAGATSDVTQTTLLQGLGAIAWASPEDQAQRPCFVLAPQYAEIIADDDARTSAMLDTTINLIHALEGQYRIDARRRYTTGQSGGCMMSIAMDIAYPGFFAASFLVAGQWDPALVQPLARQNLWILVSQDDDKAYPGQNAITEVLQKAGARISRAVWDGTWSAEQFRSAFEQIDAEHSQINYVSFRKGTVIPPGESSAGASGHRNTWRIAYTIEPIRAWLFRQHA